MTKVLLGVDRKFAVHEDTFYTEGALGPETGDRYTEYFDHVCVVGRQDSYRDGVDPDKQTRLSNSKVSFKLVESPKASESLLFRGEAMKELRHLVPYVDAVIARLPGTIGLMACRAAIEIDKPFAVDLGACAWDTMWTHGSVLGKAYAPLAFVRTKRSVKKASYISYVTQSYLQRRYPNNVAVTLSCSNVDIPPSDDSVWQFRIERLRQNREKLVFGTVGSLHGRFKGIHTALRALSLMRGSLPPFEYRILGQGDPRPWMHEAERLGVADCVYFDGTRSSGQPVLSWLDKLDMYVHPSLKEGLPRALLEAMSRGLPAVASSAAATPELLSQECLHRPGDWRRLAALLVKAVDSKWRIEHAQKNWLVSQAYTSDILQLYRREFWQSFAELIRRDQIYRKNYAQ